MAEFNGKQGVWRTVGGRRIFIVDGEDLKTAMEKSGKFKNLKKDNKEEKNDKFLQKAVALNERDKGKISEEEYFNKLSEIDGLDPEKEKTRVRENLERLGVEVPDYLKNKNQKENKKTIKEVNDEYNEYKEMRLEDPSNYTDDDYKKFNELDKKYLDKFSKEEVRAVKYRDKYAIIQNGGIQKEFDTAEEAKREVEKINKQSKLEDFHFAGEELYSDDPNRFGDLVKKHNEKMAKEQDASAKRIQERYEYDLYKRAKENPDSIDPMTENSTDWEALESKFGKKYNDEIVDSARNVKLPGKKNNTNLNKYTTSQLKSVAEIYDIDTKGLSRQELLQKLLAIFKNR